MDLHFVDMQFAHNFDQQLAEVRIIPIRQDYVSACGGRVAIAKDSAAHQVWPAPG
jgi:hypothetical protein